MREGAAFWKGSTRHELEEIICPRKVGETEQEYQRRCLESGRYDADWIFRWTPCPRPMALEIGCGLGRVTAHMAPHCAGILALDVSAEALALARQDLGELSNVEFHLLQEQSLAFLPDATFDLVYSVLLFQHINKQAAFAYLRDIQRTLKPGGVLCFTVLDMGDETAWGYFERSIGTEYPLFLHSSEEVRLMVARAGLERPVLEFCGENIHVIARRPGQ